MTKRKVAKMVLEKRIVPINDLIPYELNNKIHGDKKVNLLANMINKFSYTDEIIVDKNNIIIAGHGRAKSLAKMWYDDVEVKVMDIDSNDAIALRHFHNEISRYDTEDNLDAIAMEAPVLQVMLTELDSNFVELYPYLDAPKYNEDDYKPTDDEDKKEASKTLFIVTIDNQDDSILLEQFLEENSLQFNKKW